MKHANRGQALFLIALLLWLNIASVAQQPGTNQPSNSDQQPAAAPPSAQNPPPAASQPAPAPEKYLLKEGTEVKLKFAQDLTSKTAKTGDSVEFWLDEDLKVGDVVVVKKGAKAVGTVSHAKKNGMMGKPGELNLQLDYLKSGDTKVRLRGTQGREGQDKTGATVALVVAFGVLGFMKHGKNVEIKQGDPIKVFIGEDTPLAKAN